MAEATNNASNRTSALKAILILVAVLALEGATIGVTMWLSGPSSAKAEEKAVEGEAAEAELVELLVVRDKFPNLLTGRQVLYDMEVYITVLQKDNVEDRLKNRLEARSAQVIMEIATIVRRGEPGIFNESTLATLRRQIHAVLDERLGMNEEGESFVQAVLITRCTPFRADF
ncbi:MAG: hypothetical protein WD294_15880 [Phycisphaeraceae bacterium]